MLIISHKASSEFKKFLNDEGISYIETISNPNLNPRIADHPDLSLFKLDDKTLLVDGSVFPYYREKIQGFKLIKGEVVSSKYPLDALYNLVRFKNFYIHNNFTEKNIKKHFKDQKIKHLLVNQGYSRCSIIPLKNKLITSDYGIYKSLRDKVDIELTQRDEIILDGFDQGFLGGTCGLVGDRLVFTGDIKRHKAYQKIKDICDLEGIDIIYPQTDLVDLGSLIEI